jgi:hypothetical protein
LGTNEKTLFSKIPQQMKIPPVLSEYMDTFDYGLRYLSERRWCWRAADGSWIKTHKWAAQLYLGTEHKLSKKRASNSSLSPIDRAMSEAARSFRVDLAGDYYRDKDIQNVVDRFYRDIPKDRHGVIRSGEYKLPDGRRILLTNDAQLGLMA